eukprot:jgi/Galph1/2253/GphlegSOOS_G958.1
MDTKVFGGERDLLRKGEKLEPKKGTGCYSLVFLHKNSKKRLRQFPALIIPKLLPKTDWRRTFQSTTVTISTLISCSKPFLFFGILLPVIFGGTCMYLGLARYTQGTRCHGVQVSAKKLVSRYKPQKVVDKDRIIFLNEHA